MNALYESKLFKDFGVKGLSNLEVAKKIYDLAEQARFAVGLDASRFDACQGIEFQALEAKFLERTVGHYAAQVYVDRHMRSCEYTVKSKAFTCITPPSKQSGNVMTSAGNGIISLMVCHVITQVVSSMVGETMSLGVDIYPIKEGDDCLLFINNPRI